MLVNKGTKMHYLFTLPTPPPLCSSHSVHRPSSPARVCRPSVSAREKLFSPSTCLRGQKDRLHAAPGGKKNIYIPSSSNIAPSPPPDPTLPTPMPRFLFSISNICIWYFSPSPALHSNLLQNHADSWFVYQNIDLFSLYTFTLYSTSLLVRFHSFVWDFFFFSFSHPGSPDRFFFFCSPLFSCHRLAGWAAGKRDKRGETGQYSSGNSRA